MVIDDMTRRELVPELRLVESRLGHPVDAHI